MIDYLKKKKMHSEFEIFWFCIEIITLYKCDVFFFFYIYFIRATNL